MKVLVLSPGADTGGQGFRIKEAFDRFAPDWSVRAMHAAQNYIKYPTDVLYTPEKAQELYDWADVVHHKNRLDIYPRLDNGQNKPTVNHHQGTRLRENYKASIREDVSIGATPLVSTVDLQDGYPEAEWLPAPYNAEFLAKWREHRVRHEIRICQSPTNRKIKSTEVVIASINRLSQKYRLSFDLVENMPWKVALQRKGRSDIFIDQLILGYGNNAIEAWGMKLPVVAGCSNPNIRAKMIDLWGELPFYEATEANLDEKIADLIKDKDLREEYGLRGYNHFMKWHEESQVVKQLQRIWSEAKPSKGAAHYRGFKASS